MEIKTKRLPHHQILQIDLKPLLLVLDQRHQTDNLKRLTTIRTTSHNHIKVRDKISQNRIFSLRMHSQFWEVFLELENDIFISYSYFFYLFIFLFLIKFQCFMRSFFLFLFKCGQKQQFIVTIDKKKKKIQLNFHL